MDILLEKSNIKSIQYINNGHIREISHEKTNSFILSTFTIIHGTVHIIRAGNEKLQKTNLSNKKKQSK